MMDIQAIIVFSCICLVTSATIPPQNAASGVVITTKSPKGNMTGEYEPPELEGTTTTTPKPRLTTVPSTAPKAQSKAVGATVSPTPVVSSTFKTYFVQTKTRLNSDVVMPNVNNAEFTKQTHPMDIGFSSQNVHLQTHHPPSVGTLFNQHSDYTPLYNVNPTGPTKPPSMRTSDVIQGGLMNSNNVQVSLVAPASQKQDKFVDTSGGIPIVKEIFWPQAERTADLAKNDTVYGSLSFGQNRLLSALSNPKSLLSQQVADKTKPFDPGFGGFVLESNHEMNRPGAQKKKSQDGNGWISIGTSDLGGIQSSPMEKGLSQPTFSENSAKPLASGTGGWVEMNLVPKHQSLSPDSLMNTSDAILISNNSTVASIATTGKSSHKPEILRGLSKNEGIKSNGMSVDLGKSSTANASLKNVDAVLLKENIGVPYDSMNNQQAEPLVVIGGSMSSNGGKSMQALGSVQNSLQGTANRIQASPSDKNVLLAKESLFLGNPSKVSVEKSGTQAQKDFFFKGVELVNGVPLQKVDKVLSLVDVSSSTSVNNSSLNVGNITVNNDTNVAETVTVPSTKSTQILNPKFQAKSSNNNVMGNVFSFKAKTDLMGSPTSGNVDFSLIQELGTQTPPPTRALENVTPMAGIWPTTFAPSTHVFFTVPSTTPVTPVSSFRPWSSLNQHTQQFNRLKFNQEFHRNYQRNRNLIRQRQVSRRHLAPLLRLIQQDPYLRFAVEFERLYKSLRQTTPTTTYSLDKQALMSALLEL